MDDMVTTTLFRSNKTQAVRLPKAVEFPGDVRQVRIRCEGNVRIIEPVDSSWQQWFDRSTHVDDDFLADRDQGVAEDRRPW